MSPLIYAFVFETHPDFTLDGRWQLFLLYIAAAAIAWFINIFLLKIIPVLANIGCRFSIAQVVSIAEKLLRLYYGGRIYRLLYYPTRDGPKAGSCLCFRNCGQ